MLDQHLVFPTVLLGTIQQPWFFIVDIIGTVAFAFSGFILANREKMTLFGALILSAFPAVGGGIIRDLMVQRHPIAFLSSPVYLGLILGVVLAGFCFINASSFFHQKSPLSLKIFYQYTRQISSVFLEICDALGLAAFIVIGVTVAALKGCEPLWLWGPFFAIVTSCGGGIIRDLFCSQHRHFLLKNCFYGEIALIWGTLLSFFLIKQRHVSNPKEILLGVAVVMLGAFIMRIVVAFRKIQGFPLNPLEKKP